MSLTRPPYPSGFWEQMVELVRSGRSHDGLTSAEREELRRQSTPQSNFGWL